MIWWSYAVCTCTSTAGLKNRAEATLATCCAKYLRVVEDESITTASLPSSKDGALAILTHGGARRRGAPLHAGNNNLMENARRMISKYATQAMGGATRCAWVERRVVMFLRAEQT